MVHTWGCPTNHEDRASPLWYWKNSIISNNELKYGNCFNLQLLSFPFHFHLHFHNLTNKYLLRYGNLHFPSPCCTFKSFDLGAPSHKHTQTFFLSGAIRSPPERCDLIGAAWGQQWLSVYGGSLRRAGGDPTSCLRQDVMRIVGGQGSRGNDWFSIGAC